MPFVHMIQRIMKFNALASLATQTQVLVPPLPAQVRSISSSHSAMLRSHRLCIMFLADTCQVNNGGCTANAICSHDSTTNLAKCTCKPGYVNTGSPSNVVCTGINHWSRPWAIMIWNSDFITSFQFAAMSTTVDVGPLHCVRWTEQRMQPRASVRLASRTSVLPPTSPARVRATAELLKEQHSMSWSNISYSR